MTVKGFELRGKARTQGVTQPLSKVADSASKARKAVDETGRAFDRAASAARAFEAPVVASSSALSGFADRIRIDAVGALEALGTAAVRGAELVSDLADESVQAQAVFKNLPFSIDAAARATYGFVNNMDLAKSAVQGARLGVFESSRQFAEFANAAAKLGMSAGITATEGLDSLIAGLGRGSTEMLDNLGVVLKTADAHERYAEMLGKTAKELTTAEKAEAFRKVGIEAVISAAENVTITTDGAAAAVKRFNVELENLRTEALGGTPPVTDLHDALAQLDVTMRLSTTDLETYGAEARTVRNALRDMGVDTEVLADLQGRDLADALRKVRDEQFQYLNQLDDQHRLTMEHEKALERQLELLDKQSSKYTILAHALMEVRVQEALRLSLAAVDTLDPFRNFDPEAEADRVNLENERLGLFDKGPKKKKGSGPKRSDFEKTLGLGRGAEQRFDKHAADGLGPGLFEEEDQAKIERTLAAQEKALEQERRFEQARAEIVLSERMRGIEALRAGGADPIQMIEAEEQARVQFLEAQLQRTNDEIEREVLKDRIAGEHHRATLARLAEEDKARAKQAAMLQANTDLAIRGFEGVAQASINAAVSGNLGVRQAVHGFAQSKAIEMGILAGSETARGIAAAASPLTAALAPGHFHAAGVAAATGAGFGVLAGVTFSGASQGAPSGVSGSAFGLGSAGLGGPSTSSSSSRSLPSAPISRPSGAGASAAVQAQTGSASSSQGRGPTTVIVHQQALAFGTYDEQVMAVRQALNHSQQDLGRD